LLKYILLQQTTTMTIAYNEWKTREIKKATDEAKRLIDEANKLNEKLGTELINPIIYLIMLRTTIEHLQSKETLRWFLQKNQEF
jgi:hypothetical protein